MKRLRIQKSNNNKYIFLILENKSPFFLLPNIITIDIIRRINCSNPSISGERVKKATRQIRIMIKVA